ncbi:MAG: ferredoxin [Alphaproteobacteria bacterium]|nr:MAG: ferredoxin [Alphaproteobacteria bacterium]
MAKLIVTTREGETSEVEGERGISVMEILRDNDFEVAAICGGCCSCATCHVYVDEEWMDKLPAREEDERELLEELESFKDNSRLSCQIEFTDDLDGLQVTIAPDE